MGDISRHASVALENSLKTAVSVAWNAVREQTAAENNQIYIIKKIRADFFPSRRDLSVVIKDPEGYEEKKTENLLNGKTNSEHFSIFLSNDVLC